jgi:hypothetical protein
MLKTMLQSSFIYIYIMFQVNVVTWNKSTVLVGEARHMQILGVSEMTGLRRR